MPTNKELENAISGFSEQLKQISLGIVAMNERFDMLEQYVNKKIKTLKEEIFSEMRNRKEKETNVIIFGLQDKKGEDLMKETSKILEAIDMESEKKDVAFVRRIGKVQEGKVRPIKLGFFCSNSAQKALGNSKLLKSKEMKIFIREDLTQSQIEHFNELKEKMLARNEELEKDRKNKEKWIMVGKRSNPFLKKVTKR